MDIKPSSIFINTNAQLTKRIWQWPYIIYRTQYAQINTHNPSLKPKFIYTYEAEHTDFMAHLVDSVGLSWSLQGIICSATTQRLCWTIGKLDEGGFKGKIKQKNLPGRNPALPQLIKKKSSCSLCAKAFPAFANDWQCPSVGKFGKYEMFCWSLSPLGLGNWPNPSRLHLQDTLLSLSQDWERQTDLL